MQTETYKKSFLIVHLKQQLNFFSICAKQHIDIGIVEALHPFGKTLNFNPHVHAIATYGGYDSQGNFIQLNYVHYKSFHKIWKFNILESLKDKVPKNVIDYCYSKYKGFVAHINPKKLYKNKNLIKYIGRYLRHPAIANSRIIDYNGKGITFCYETKEGKWGTQTMKVHNFIKAILQHLPPKHFKLVRYYGIYGRRSLKYKKIKNLSSIKQKVLVNPTKEHIIYCPNCGEKMQLIKFVKKPP